MKSAVEFHDSECLSIETDAHGNGLMLLDAYVHRTDGEPGVSPGEGGMQHVRFSIESMTVSDEIGSLPASIFDGSLKVGSSSFDNLLPLPSVLSGEVSLAVELFDDARTISIAGKNVSITSDGEFRFVEHVNLH